MERVCVVSKCSNPGCSKPFRYLHEGRLFRIEKEFQVEAGSRIDEENYVEHSSRLVEFYWLCAECCGIMTIHYDPQAGVTILPLVSGKIANL